MSTFSESVRDDIDRDGVSVIHVGDTKPPFAYTVGLWETCKHAELIVFGLPGRIMASILNAVSRRVHDGHRYSSSTFVEGIGGNFGAMVQPVQGDYLEQYFGFALNFYGATFPVAQVLWSDSAGHFPADSNYDEAYAELQPILDTHV